MDYLNGKEKDKEEVIEEVKEKIREEVREEVIEQKRKKYGKEINGRKIKLTLEMVKAFSSLDSLEREFQFFLKIKLKSFMIFIKMKIMISKNYQKI